MSIYVDGIIVTSNDEYEQQRLSQCLAREFKIKAVGKLKLLLGIEVDQSKKWNFISQQKYISDVLQETSKMTWNQWTHLSTQM